MYVLLVMQIVIYGVASYKLPDIIYVINATAGDNNLCKGENFFKCHTVDVCIVKHKLCDGQVDCPDSSDESIKCKDYVLSCPEFAFKCDYGACIDGNLKCDNQQNCADNSDERDSACWKNEEPEIDERPITVCGVSDFVCNDGSCIDQLKVCDGTKHCSDGSDETYKKCYDKKCPSSSYQCKYGACVHKFAKCNGIDDCADGSDEARDLCKKESNTPIPGFKPIWTIYKCHLPKPPRNGAYSITSSHSQLNTDFVDEGTYLTYQCDKNYALSSKQKHYICVEGKWSPSTFPHCARTRSFLRDVIGYF